MRRLAAVVLIVLGAAVILGRGHAFASIVFGRSKTTTTAITEPITSIVVTAGNGDVHVRSGSETSVKRTEHWLFTRPRVSVSQSNGVLRVSAHCPAQIFNHCSVDFTATVPAGTDATVTTTNGDVGVSGLDGPRVGVRTTNGDVELTRLASDLVKAETTNGDVSAMHVRGPLDVQTTNGDVQVSMDDKGSATLKTNNGDVGLSVPSGGYAVDVHTNNGDVTKHGITEDSSAGDTLSVRTNNGDVTITGR